MLLVLVVLTGCISLPPPQPGDLAAQGGPLDPFDAVRAAMAGVPCRADVGAGTSANLRELGLVDFDSSRHEMLDARGDHLLVSRDQLGGLEVVDIADPMRPALVATLMEFAPEVLDVKWTPDGKGALLGNYTGIGVVDLRDLSEPRLVHVWTYDDPHNGANVHMLYAKRIAGADWVFMAPNDDTGIHILRLEGAWPEKTLSSVTTFAPGLNGGPLGPHDMTVLDDEMTRKPIMYVANGFEGWLAADVSDPAHPALLGGIVNADPFQSYTHTVVAESIGGRRIVATIAEVGVNALKIFDATDLQRPVLLATWQANRTAPNHPEHNLQLLDGLLYVAHYHEGLFVFDLNTLGSRPLVGTVGLSPIAHYAPPDLRETNDEFQRLMGFKNVWDVVVNKGMLYVNDAARGVLAMGFACLEAGDPKATSSA